MLATLLIASWAVSGRQVAIEIPPGIHTYPELASILTFDGIPSKCDSTIRNRAALIRLDPMNWTRLKATLESALDIRFVIQEDGSFILHKDPVEAEEEANLLRRFSSRYEHTIRDAVQGGWGLYQKTNVGYPNRSGSDPFENLIEAKNSLPIGDPNRDAIDVTLLLKDRVESQPLLANLWDGIDFERTLKGPAKTVATAEEISSWIEPDNPIGRELPPPAYELPEVRDQHLRDPYRLAVLGWNMNPKTFGLTYSFVGIMKDAFSDAAVSSEFELVPQQIGIECNWDDLFRSLSERSDYQKRVEASAKFLASEDGSQAVDLAKTNGTFGQLMESWSVKKERQIVMEILSARDPGFDTTKSLGSASPKTYCHGLAEEAITPSVIRSPWTFVDSNGVLVVRDELRFIDHLAQPNLSAALFLNAARMKSGLKGNSVLDLLDASALVSADEDAAAGRFAIYPSENGFNLAYPYLCLIKSDTRIAREVSALPTTGALNVPYRTFSKDARRQFERSVTLLASSFAMPNSPAASWLWVDSLIPEYFDQALSSADVSIQLHASGDSCSIDFQLSATGAGFTTVGLCPTSLGHVVVTQTPPGG